MHSTNQTNFIYKNGFIHSAQNVKDFRSFTVKSNKQWIRVWLISYYMSQWVFFFCSSSSDRKKEVVLFSHDFSLSFSRKATFFSCFSVSCQKPCTKLFEKSHFRASIEVRLLFCLKFAKVTKVLTSDHKACYKTATLPQGQENNFFRFEILTVKQVLR